MEVIQLFAILMVFSVVKSKPTTESTHAILKRLGFDPVQRSSANHHIKRVALQTNKARYHNDFHSSNSDSRMFVVKLPPHSPYYSHVRPEKFKSDSTSKFQTNFRTNGKPGQIYHWNIPILKNLPLEKKGFVRNQNEDSKVYHIKILPNQTPPKYVRHNPHKKIKQKIKLEEKTDGTKPNKHNRNKLFRFTDAQISATTLTNHSVVEPDTPRHRAQNSSAAERHGYYIYDSSARNKNYFSRKKGDKYVNEVSKLKTKNRGPNYYVPSIPKQNSFYKYFSGNGKPKSFYVIEKSKKPTRLHRLL